MESSDESYVSVVEDSRSVEVINSLDLLIGFTEARRRAEEKKSHVDDEEIYQSFLPHRVFLNNVDSFNGKEISSLLVKEIYAAQENDHERANEEEVDIAESNERVPRKASVAKVNIQVIGTVSDERIKQMVNVKEIVPFQQSESFIDTIMDCGYIIYDITSDSSQIQEADWVLQCIEQKLRQKQDEQADHTVVNRSNETRTFILVSTVMTWSRTKPMDPDDPEVPFVDTDYRKRRPHPNYKAHIDLEKKVVKLGKTFDKFRTLVVCSGIVYGKAESDLHPLFKLAWLGEPFMPIFLPGNNEIPLIHVTDLAKIVVQIIHKNPTKAYILAVEQLPTTLKQIIKGLSKTMGSGKTKVVSKEEAFLYDEITQDVFDKVTVNLKMEPAFVMNDLAIQWTSELHLSENVHAMCTEYKEARGLKPIKIIVHGPPAAGKTRLANALCAHYKLHYINIKQCIAEKVNYLTKMIESIKEMEEAKLQQEEADAEEDLDDASQEESTAFYQEKLDEINTALKEDPRGRLDEGAVIKLMREKLLSNECQCQGYVMDGYPKTIAQANKLFAKGDDEETEGEEEEEHETEHFSKKLVPEFVVSLQASDEFLCERVMYLPEKDVQGTPYAEDEMIRRLLVFRELNMEDNSVMVYFDEIEINPMLLSVMKYDDDDMNRIFEIMKNAIGKPRNFGLSKQEAAEQARREKNERRAEKMRRQKEHELREQQMQEERETKMEEWARLMLEIRKEEVQILAMQSEPLRHYLMKFVFPTLTKGLLEVARLRPDDPIDFLAEFLFKENPEGHMFDPAYTEAADKLHTIISQIQSVLNEFPVENDDTETEDCAEPEKPNSVMSR